MSAEEETAASRPPPGGAAWSDRRPEPRLSLIEHLTELRGRLLKSVIAILILSIVGFVMARPLFGILMRPVLAALPASDRMLIYTSGIEEVNVLLKVGLYGGVLLATPVLLWQVWGFIAPGLLPEERRFTAPFILAGTLAFAAGVSFCYFAVLPGMFQWLLSEGQAPVLTARIDGGGLAEEDALRFLRLGEPSRAGEIAHRGWEALGVAGEGQITTSSAPPTSAEVSDRLQLLGNMVDALQIGFGGAARPVLVRVLERRAEAMRAHQLGHETEAAILADGAAAQLAAALPGGAEGVTELWHLGRVRIRGRAQLASEQWTKPMLSMSEQLSLVLVLLIAFGFIFELPLVMALLTTLGVVRAAFLVKYQRHAFVVCLIVAAVITPTGDVVNLSLMAGPMVLCYELGTLASWLIERRRDRAARSIAQAV